MSWEVNFPHKNGPIPLWLAPHMIIQNLPPPNLYALSSPIDMATMIRYHIKFPLLLDSPGKPDHQAIHCPTANFGPLSRGSVTNPILITVFDTYLTPRSPVAWVWVKTLPILNVVPELTSPWVWPVNT